MGYCTRQDLYTAFGRSEIDRLANKNRPAGGDADAVEAARASVFNQALARADIKINAIVGDAIAAVLADPATAAALKYPALDLARYYLYDDLVTDAVEKRKVDAEATLTRIRAGSEGLGRAVGGDSAMVDMDSAIQMTAPGEGRGFQSGVF